MVSFQQLLYGGTAIVGFSLAGRIFYDAYKLSQEEYRKGNRLLRKQSPHIVLGSTSPIKIDAVRTAFDKAWCARALVTPHKVDLDDMPEQPVGKGETEKCASRRAYHVMEKVATAATAKAAATGKLEDAASNGADFYIGIENGMWFHEDVQRDGDVGVIYIIYRTANDMYKTDIVHTHTLYIPFPEEQYYEFPNPKNGRWSSSDDPHSLLTHGKMSRADFLSNALTEWLIRNTSA